MKRSPEHERLTLLPLTALGSRCRVPPRNSKVSFELRPRETLILKCLCQERPFLIRTECCSLPIQRSDGAIPAHVFQNSLPTHSPPPFPFCRANLCTRRFAKSLARLAERAHGLRTVDLPHKGRLADRRRGYLSWRYPYSPLIAFPTRARPSHLTGDVRHKGARCGFITLLGGPAVAGPLAAHAELGGGDSRC
jgi:hypothetical protein